MIKGCCKLVITESMLSKLQLKMSFFFVSIFLLTCLSQQVSGDCCWPVYYPDRDCGIKLPPYNNNSNKTDLIPKPPMPWPTLCYDCEPPYGLYCGVGMYGHQFLFMKIIAL